MDGTHENAKVKRSGLEIIPSCEPNDDGDRVRNINCGDGHGENGVDGLFAREDEEAEG